MAPRAYLSVQPLSFGTSMAQSEGIAWMQAALARSVSGPDAERARRFYGLLQRQTQIERRVTCLDDYTHQDWGRMRLHAPLHSGDGQAGPDAGLYGAATLDARMELFAQTANAIAADAFAGDAEPPDALVQVSCTGYDSPNAVQRLAAARGWADRTRILHVGHMGCYAALPAAAMAADLAMATAARAVPAGADDDAAGDARVSILLVELCTIHHDPTTTDVEQVVQQCLFADGAARIDVTAQPRPGAFALLDHAEALLPDSLESMTWRPADGGFRMTLARDIPERIQASVGALVDGLLARNGLSRSDIGLFGIHPGGPRVIESTAEALGLSGDQIRHSQAVLRERGNMSSTTLPHVWAGIAEDPAVAPGTLVCSVAFGPGLTAVANLMRVGG